MKGNYYDDTNITVGSTKPYMLASIIALIIGISAFFVGLFNSQMALNEKGYYLIILLYGLCSMVSLQKNSRYKTK